ncbi:MAG: NAD(P)H-hydrate dehydratase [Planctomycetes bacterium]|nr:NAD(P)H-hydrate dehydratase [Planctomycetota bacterium]
MSSAPRPPPQLPPDAHKGDAGRVLCLAGSESMPGAAILCARAAQRAGAGLVALGCLDATLLTVVPAAAPEAVLVDLSEAFERGGRVRPGARERLLARAPHAVLLGPGLGDDARTRAVLTLVLETFEVPLVLDADALNALDGAPERLRAARAPCVLTPHPGEAARLLGREVPRESAGRAAAAQELAARAGAIVCLKGRGTVVCAPGEAPWVNASGNPGLATAGAGDVLAGILVAYLALVRSLPDAGWSALDGARAAVYVHGLAGDLAAASRGARALIASDLIAELPGAQLRFEGGAATPT